MSPKRRPSRSVAMPFVAVALGCLAMGCPGAESSPAPSGTAAASSTTDVSAAAPDSVSAVAAPSASASSQPSVAGDPACPANMVLVDGLYCPAPLQHCLEQHEEYVKEQERLEKLRARGEHPTTTVSERCLRYQEPSRCLSDNHRPMRFCIDRYEWPNKKGELPILLVSWHDATRLCKEAGKRLCTVDEFNFACEGEAMLPYTYGYVRDPTKCNIDKPYRRREKKLKKYDACLKDPSCKAELERLDQREPAGSRPQCVSPFGVYDLNGNANEWVVREGEKPPNRSGLKSGWWGPVRGRCRPTVGFHKEDDYGYEVGFRCCRDAQADAADAGVALGRDAGGAAGAR